LTSHNKRRHSPFPVPAKVSEDQPPLVYYLRPFVSSLSGICYRAVTGALSTQGTLQLSDVFSTTHRNIVGFDHVYSTASIFGNMALRICSIPQRASRAYCRSFALRIYIPFPNLDSNPKYCKSMSITKPKIRQTLTLVGYPSIQSNPIHSILNAFQAQSQIRSSN
jgi:hypothetical protein